MRRDRRRPFRFAKSDRAGSHGDSTDFLSLRHRVISNGRFCDMIPFVSGCTPTADPHSRSPRIAGFPQNPPSPNEVSPRFFCDIRRDACHSRNPSERPESARLPELHGGPVLSKTAVGDGKNSILVADNNLGDGYNPGMDLKDAPVTLDPNGPAGSAAFQWGDASTQSSYPHTSALWFEPIAVTNVAPNEYFNLGNLYYRNGTILSRDRSLVRQPRTEPQFLASIRTALRAGIVHQRPHQLAQHQRSGGQRRYRFASQSDRSHEFHRRRREHLLPRTLLPGG